MKLIIPIVLTCILVLGIYLADKYTAVKKLPYMAKQAIIGVLFGGVSALASSVGMDWLGATVNVRDAAPLSAGLIFGAPAGIIAGFIGGIYRWFSVYWGGGEYTRLACSLATILAGFLAAGVRKGMFDDKKPNWVYGTCIAVVCEVLHMIMIFITNMGNSYDAFEFVKGATLPMVIGNATAVGVSLIMITLLSRDWKAKRQKSERIANTFQRWLLICISVAFLTTSAFTFIVQNGIAKVETDAVFTKAMSDVENDVVGKSNEQLLAIAEKVKADYGDGTGVDLTVLANNYELEEINVVDKDGIIRESTEADVIDKYDMNSADQSKQFVDEIVRQKEDFFVQEYSKRGKDGETWRKYAAIKLTEGEYADGFIQVGYGADQFHGELDKFVIEFTKNRHVGTGGFVAVCDEEFKLVIDDEKYNKLHISEIGIDPNKIKQGENEQELFDATIKMNASAEEGEKYLYKFQFIEGYCIIAAMPKAEAMFMRDASIYTSVFMQVLIFAALFVFIYVLIKKVIINNLRKVNSTLGRITEGDLTVTVDVRSNEEFASLSDDINSTVSTLKRYIAEAAARIDKELEYAKQIQLSALPTKFPEGEDYDVYAQMIAAKEVGGDFYDFYKLSDTTLAFLVADVSGKGIPAAMFMMTAKTIIKDLAERGLPVNEIFTKANEKLCENNESGMFVTAWMGILDITTGTLTFANAGHNPPLVKSADGTFEYLKTRAGFVLAGMEGVRYRIGERTLMPGDRVFLYTDGVTEATNVDNQLYGEERLRNFINENIETEGAALLPALKQNIDEFVGEAPQFDDITMLIFDYKCKEGGVTMTDKSFPAKVDALSDVLAFVEETLEKYDCSMKVQTALCVAIEEVFVNVAHYAYQGGEGDVFFGITFDENSRYITFRMEDTGTPFDPLQKEDPDITLSAEEREIGGLGIFITKKTMDEIAYVYEDGKNILTMSKKI